MPASPSDPDVPSREERVMLGIADRSRWRPQIDEALAAVNGSNTGPEPDESTDSSATTKTAETAA